MSELKPVTIENIHIIIPRYIQQNRITIMSYEDMMDTILSMMRDKYFFSMDKDHLRDCLTDLTYIYSPGDDRNKERVIDWLDPPDDDDDDGDSDDGEIQDIPPPS